MSTISHTKKSNMVHYTLTLEDGTDIQIPIRETDGYIHANKLCRSASKTFSAWYRLVYTKKLISTLSERLSVPVDQLVEFVNYSSVNLQGSWIHPDLGIFLLQWLHPSFAFQMSKWTRELLFTHSVTLGSELKEPQLLDEVKREAAEAQEKLRQAGEIIASQEAEKQTLEKELRALTAKHQSIVFHKKGYHLKEGLCVYLIQFGSRLKIGKSNDINRRVSDFRTIDTSLQLIMVLYTPHNSDVEQYLLKRYRANLVTPAREVICDVQAEEVIKVLQEYLLTMNYEHVFETQEKIDMFNSHFTLSNQDLKEMIEEIKEEESYTVRCGGITHTTEESRILPLTLQYFYGNKSNANGFNRLCKNCYEKTTYGDKRKKKKVVVVPDFDILTEKWCNKCERILTRSEFYNDKDKPDGLGSNCKDCKLQQKHAAKARRLAKLSE
jgi:hypothetical protein